jgi:hypothetical protein
MKPVLIMLSLLLSMCAFAQVEKGRFLVGGSADISQANQSAPGGHKISSFNLSIAPSFGAFVVKGFALGGRYAFGVGSNKSFSNSKKEYVTVTTFSSSIGPFARYYIGKKPLKGLISGSVNYLTSVTLNSGSVSGTDGFNATGLLGMAYFFNPHISLETGLYISGSSFKKQYPVTRIGLSVGFFAFLDKKKKE